MGKILGDEPRGKWISLEIKTIVKERDELKAHIERFKIAFNEDKKGDSIKAYQMFLSSVNETPAQSLQQYRDKIAQQVRQEVIEECAATCDGIEADTATRIKDNGKAATAYMCAATIRALKGESDE